MNTGNKDTGIKICPYCAEQIKRTALKCKHCGEFIGDKRPSSDSKLTNSETRLQGTNQFISGLLLLGAAFFNVLFCAESPLAFISASNPIGSIAGSIGYSIPGMIISIIFFVPTVNYLKKDNVGKGFFKGFTIKSVTIALYIGAAIRLVLFIIKFKV